MLRKMTASLLCVAMTMMLATPAWAATTTTTTSTPLLDRLAEVEIALYGSAQVPGALLPRVQRVEADLYGKPSTSNEAIIVRIERLSNLVSKGGASLLMKLNAAEWMIFQTQTSHKPLFERLAVVEEGVFGQSYPSKGIAERVEDLVGLVWPGGVLNTAPVPVPPGTKVRAKILTDLNSSTNREGDLVRHQVIADVKIDNKVIIPIGTEFVGVVKQVTKPGPFGRAGSVGIEAGSVRAIDGSLITLTFQQTAPDRGAQDLAAGASLGGMVLLGPLGLAAGYLVQGRSEIIPAGTEITLEVKDAVTVQGLSLVPMP